MQKNLSLFPLALDIPIPQTENARANAFAIILERGSYDSYSMDIVGVSNDHLAAQAWVDKMNALHRSLRRKLHQLQEDLLLWRDANPVPATIVPALLAVPLLPVGHAPTIEEREEKHRINNENFMLTLAAREPQRQHLRQENNFSQTWLSAHLTPEEAELHLSGNDSRWSIQSVPWMVF